MGIKYLKRKWKNATVLKMYECRSKDDETTFYYFFKLAL